MQVRYLVDSALIPDDGSANVIARFADGINDESCEAVIYPDVHYKKGARSVNGMLLASRDKIYPALLGVPNCGFTFGRLEGATISQKEQLRQTFAVYASANKNSHSPWQACKHLTARIREGRPGDCTLEFCASCGNGDMEKVVQSVLPARSLRAASRGLGDLGGGNHFFELHRVDSIYMDLAGLKEGDIVFIVHSDSGPAGIIANLLFSNLSELGHLNGRLGLRRRLRERLSQMRYFALTTGLLFRDFSETAGLLFSGDDLRSIQADSATGRQLLLASAVAAAVGEMNRRQILSDYLDAARRICPNLHCEVLGSHSHDSLSVENHGGAAAIVHRNGVQYVADSPLYILPGALGTESFLFLNTHNEEAYLSANHGVGRLLDKHVAGDAFALGSVETLLKDQGTSLFRVGSENLAEQHPMAFKHTSAVAEVMERYNLGKRAARLVPIAAIKG